MDAMLMAWTHSSIITGVAIALFLIAYSNENAAWKSEKIDYTIDYTDMAANHQYEMPYIFIFFKVSMPRYATADWLSPEEINNTLHDLLTSQNNFVNKSGFIYLDNMNTNLHDVQSTFGTVNAVALYDEDWVKNDSFIGYFRLKPHD